MRPPRTPMSRFVVAMVAYLVGSIAIEYALLLVNVQFHLHLERQQSLFPAGFPVLGSMSWYSLIYLAALVALILLLYRTRVMPRELFGRPPIRQRADWDTNTMGPREMGPRAQEDAARTQDDERIL
jgi:hypothetical protein